MTLYFYLFKFIISDTPKYYKGRPYSRHFKMLNENLARTLMISEIIFMPLEWTPCSGVSLWNDIQTKSFKIYKDYSYL